MMWEKGVVENNSPAALACCFIYIGRLASYELQDGNCMRTFIPVHVGDWIFRNSIEVGGGDKSQEELFLHNLDRTVHL